MMLQKEEKYEGVEKEKIHLEDESFEKKGREIGRKALTQFKKFVEKQ